MKEITTAYKEAKKTFSSPKTNYDTEQTYKYQTADNKKKTEPKTEREIFRENLKKVFPSYSDEQIDYYMNLCYRDTYKEELRIKFKKMFPSYSDAEIDFLVNFYYEEKRNNKDTYRKR